MLYHFQDASNKQFEHFSKQQTLDVFASFGGKLKSSQSISSSYKKTVFILTEVIFHSLWAIKVSTKRKPSLEHVSESLRISDVCSSKPLTTKHTLGICLSSIFFIEETHLQLSNGWSDLATLI